MFELTESYRLMQPIEKMAAWLYRVARNKITDKYRKKRPYLLDGPVINFWQSIGLMLLTRILFRGFHGMHGRGMQYGNWGGWKERFEKMNPEQREKMRELWKKRCGGFSCDEEEKKDSI